MAMSVLLAQYVPPIDQKYIDAHQNNFGATPATTPPYFAGYWHCGDDISCPAGTIVVSPVNGKIFDVRGRLVVGALPAGPVPNSLIWDGKTGGKPVPSGTYIYQLSAAGKTYTGTVFIIK